MISISSSQIGTYPGVYYVVCTRPKQVVNGSCDTPSKKVLIRCLPVIR